MPNHAVPNQQRIYINSSQGRIFDFNTPSSRVYLGEAVNSLLRTFGNNAIITGFRILDIIYNSDEDIEVHISPGEAILDYTLIKYVEPIVLHLDVSGYDDTGFIIPNLFFNFVTTQQKNLSSIRLTYVTSNGHVPTNQWFTEYSIVVLAKIGFNKTNKSAVKEQIPVLNRQNITIENKEYTIYPFDNISRRILMYLNDTFN